MIQRDIGGLKMTFKETSAGTIYYTPKDDIYVFPKEDDALMGTYSDEKPLQHLTHNMINYKVYVPLSEDTDLAKENHELKELNNTLFEFVEACQKFGVVDATDSFSFEAWAEELLESKDLAYFNGVRELVNNFAIKEIMKLGIIRLELLEACLKIQKRGYFEPSNCADKETNNETRLMKLAIEKAMVR